MSGQLFGKDDRRIAALERQVQSLQMLVRSQRTVSASRQRVVRLAVTAAESSVYPDVGDNASCYPIIFVDGEYTEAQGVQPLTATLRNAAPVAVVYSVWERTGLLDWIPEGTLINVWWERDRWWTDWAPDRQDWVKTTSGTPSGSFYPAVVQRWSGAAWVDVATVKLLEVNGDTLQNDKRYLARCIGSESSEPLFATNTKGGTSPADWAWFKGTTTAGMSGTGPHTITFVKRWGGETVASPVYVWNNPALLRCPSSYTVWGIGQLTGSTWDIEIMQVKHQAAAVWADPIWGDTEYDLGLGTVAGCALSAREPTIALMADDLLPDVEVQIQFHDQAMVSAVFWDGTDLTQTVKTICLPQPKDSDDEIVFSTVTQVVVTGLNIDADSLNAPKQTIRVFDSDAATQDEIPLFACEGI